MAASASEASYGDEEFDAESQGASESAALTEELSRTLNEPILSDEELAEEESKVEARSEKEEPESPTVESLALSAASKGSHTGALLPGRQGAAAAAAYDAKRDGAAVRIQSAARGRRARKHAKTEKKKMEDLKYLASSTEEMMRYATEYEGSKTTSMIEGDLEDMEYDLAKIQAAEAKPYTAEHISATLKIQKIQRGRVARKEAKRRKAAKRKKSKERISRQAEEAARRKEEAARRKVPPSPTLSDKMDTALLHWSYGVNPTKEKAERSAVKIQSLQRGIVGRERARKLRETRAELQKHWNVAQNRKVQQSSAAPPQGAEAADREAAALAIQKATRSKAARKQPLRQDAGYKEGVLSVVRNALRGVYNTAIANANAQLMREDQRQSDAAVKLQSACRGRLARREVKKRQKAKVQKPPQDKGRTSSSVVSSGSDGQPSRRSQAKAKKVNEKVIVKDFLSEDAQRAIVKIQASVRKVWNTKEHQLQKKKSIKKKRTEDKMQDEWSPEAVRATLARKSKAKAMEETQERSALQIQRLFRGNVAREKTKKMKEERDDARREARRKAEERNAAWDEGFRSSFCHSTRLSVSDFKQADASARRIQRFARKRTNSFLKSKTQTMEKLPEAEPQEQSQAGVDKIEEEIEEENKPPVNEAVRPHPPGGIDQEKARELDEAIIRIQAAQRRRQARKDVKNLKRQKEVEAATLKIQAIRRGVTTRRDHQAPARPPSLQSASPASMASRPQSVQSRPLSVQARCHPESSEPLLEQAVPEMAADSEAAADEEMLGYALLHQAAEQQALAEQEVPVEEEVAAEPELVAEAMFELEDELNLTMKPGMESDPADDEPQQRRSRSEILVAVATDSTAACIEQAIAASSLGGAAPPADVLEAAAVAASASAVRPVTRRSFDAQGLEEVPDIAAMAMAVAGVPSSRPASRQNCVTEGLEEMSHIAAVPSEAAAYPAEQAAGEENLALTSGRGSSWVCDLAVQCSDPDDQEEDIVLCGTPIARPHRQTYYFVRHVQAQTDVWMLGENQMSSADFSFDGNFEPHASQALQGPVLWTTPPLATQPSSLPRKCPKSGRRLRRPAPVGAGTLRAGAIYKNPPCSPAAPVEVAAAARGFAEPRQPSSGSAPPSRRGRSTRPYALREGLKPPGSAPAGSSSASPGLGKVRQPLAMLSAFGRVLDGPTAAYSARDVLKDRSQSPPTSCSQLRRLCDPLWKNPSSRNRLRSPGAALAAASQSPPGSARQAAMADAVRQREGLGTAPAAQSGARGLEEETFADASRDANSACRLSSAPGSRRKPKAAAVAVPGILAKPRSAKLSPNRPLWQDAGKDGRLGMKKLPWLPAAFNAATVYDPRFMDRMDRDIVNHFPRPFDARHLEEEIMGRP
mmetsp:Transcript_68593/g.130560  ORF Transcript_68593/g.130560 Transcript_68593/m.130560 type:complete len:1381 (-) Transcript_68593:56-4198(-)